MDLHDIVKQKKSEKSVAFSNENLNSIFSKIDKRFLNSEPMEVYKSLFHRILGLSKRGIVAHVELHEFKNTKTICKYYVMLRQLQGFDMGMRINTDCYLASAEITIFFE